jgi:hypothetical protein
MLALFILHHVLNRRWYGGLFRGKYTPRRVFQTALDTLLLVFMIMQPVSGILMSRYLYTFISIPGGAAWARRLHLILAYWGFVLMCLHAGTHLYAPMDKLRRNSRGAFVTVAAVLCAVSVYGCYAFAKRGLAGYMFGKTAFAFFDFAEPRVFFFLDYIAVMVLFAAVGCAVMRLLRRGK